MSSDLFTDASKIACYRSPKTMKRCPRCSSEETRRSARRGIERVLSWVGLYPFRCEACNGRFYGIAVGAHGHAQGETGGR
jgi:hypothetical protein